jgi:hypothetical protein
MSAEGPPLFARCPRSVRQAEVQAAGDKEHAVSVGPYPALPHFGFCPREDERDARPDHKFSSCRLSATKGDFSVASRILLALE